ncbi:MAG: alpha/beta hydrolase [Muribaculaceae bacterium]|nr:alpha/beta hydrolase [Muribaculaceae bacterium]
MKKLFIAAMMTLAMTLTATADNFLVPVPDVKVPVEIGLWPQGAPTANGISAESENSDNPDWVYNVSEPTLTVFPAANPNGMAIVMCPGGGYAGLAIKHEGFDMAKDLNKAGITLAVLKYRMPNGHKEVPADDARQAIRLLRENAAQWGIDPGRIGIAGASAGGHLASTVATHKTDDGSAPNFQILLYPVISMKKEITHMGSRENLLGRKVSGKTVRQYSNEEQVSGTTPPAFIVATSDDDVVPIQNSLLYYQALTKHGVPASLHIYPKGGHGWAYTAFPDQPLWVRELLNWLSKL